MSVLHCHQLTIYLGRPQLRRGIKPNRPTHTWAASGSSLLSLFLSSLASYSAASWFFASSWLLIDFNAFFVVAMG